jgi:hypothetical protein
LEEELGRETSLRSWTERGVGRDEDIVRRSSQDPGLALGGMLDVERQGVARVNDRKNRKERTVTWHLYAIYSVKYLSCQVRWGLH